MRRDRPCVSVLLALGVAAALASCGTTATPTVAPTSSAVLGPTQPPVSINAAFCQQAATLVAQFAPIAAAEGIFCSNAGAATLSCVETLA